MTRHYGERVDDGGWIQGAKTIQANRADGGNNGSRGDITGKRKCKSKALRLTRLKMYERISFPR